MLRPVSGLAMLCALVVATPAFAQMRCTRDDLQKVADGYVAAVAAGDSTKIPLGEWTRYSENGDDSVSMNGGVMEKPKPIAYHHNLLDTTTCQTYTELVVTDAAHPYVIGTRIQTMGGRAGEIESVVTDAGDWLFNAANTAKYAKAEDWGPLPAAQRSDRATILAAANAYLDYFNNKSVAVPWGTPCNRLEGGLRTGKGQPDDSCNVGVPNNIPITNRHAVVDEEQGAAAVFNTFGPSKRPDIHTFRIENGKIRYVHTLTVCDTPNCGFKMPTELK